ncbi:MAG: hypothetical protein IJD81_11095 [Oscillospiraceae bacterium]|nr:hypothetical protein [Oscillospiraceae bacterium]
MAKSWLYKYGNDTIKVINKNFEGSELYINGELSDQRKGFGLRDCLTASLKSGETITATLEGAITIDCSLCIDGKPQAPVEVK